MYYHRYITGASFDIKKQEKESHSKKDESSSNYRNLQLQQTALRYLPLIHLMEIFMFVIVFSFMSKLG